MSAAQTVIEATRGWRAIDLGEIWKYRGLLYIFAWRDLKVRYRQTLLGAVWIMGQPLVTMVIFTVLFNRVAKLQSEPGVPYPLFVLAGTLMWGFVSGVINRAGGSLIGAGHLISKVYFPRLVIPLAQVGTDLVDFFVTAVLLVPMMAWYGFVPGPEILLAPLVVALAGIFGLGIGLWLAALNVEYRDIRIVVPWILQVAMYVTPVVYPLSALPPALRPFAVLNPATGIVEAFRATVFGTVPSFTAIAVSIVTSIVLLLTGAFYFRRLERLFADVL